MKRLLVETADREGSPVERAISPQGNSDAAPAHRVREGIPTGVVNIPRRYSHTPVETADLNDAANALRLIEAVASLTVSLLAPVIIGRSSARATLTPTWKPPESADSLPKRSRSKGPSAPTSS